MYELKEVTLRNKNIEKKRLVIKFEDEKYAILAEFLMSDAMLLSEELTLAFKQVNNEEKIILTGNRCAVEIESTQTKIVDLFAEYDSGAYQPLNISTNEFENYISIWHEELNKFNKKNI